MQYAPLNVTVAIFHLGGAAIVFKLGRANHVSRPVARYKEVFPICIDIVSFGIGFPELLALHAAVMKKVDMEKISYGEAAFDLMNDIDSPGKGRKAKATELYDYAALVKLHYYGITENQIMNLCRVMIWMANEQ